MASWEMKLGALDLHHRGFQDNIHTYHSRSSFILRMTFLQSSVTPPLAGLVDVVHRACDGHPSRPPAVVVHLAWGPLTRHGAGGGNLKKSGSTTRATSTLAYSNPSPSSHGSEMVKNDRRGLILTKPKTYHSTLLRRTCAIYGQIPNLRRHVVKTRNLVNKWRICDVTVSYDTSAWSSLWCGSIAPTFMSQFPM